MGRSTRTPPEEMTARALVDHCLRTLAVNVKTGSIGIYELRCLYAFIIVARRAKLRWTASDVEKRLVEQGVDEGRAEELGQVYGHCRAVLHLAGKGDQRDEVWSRFLS